MRIFGIWRKSKNYSYQEIAKILDIEIYAVERQVLNDSLRFQCAYIPSQREKSEQNMLEAERKFMEFDKGEDSIFCQSEDEEEKYRLLI